MPKKKKAKEKGRALRFVITISIMLLMMVGTLVGLYIYMEFLLRSQERQGFSEDDLSAPGAEARPLSGEDPPIFIESGPSPSYSCRLIWPVNGTSGKLDTYAGIGAVLNLSLSNIGQTDLYVESVRAGTGWGSSAGGEVGKYVYSGETRYLRHLLVPVPDPVPAGDLNCTLSLDILIEDGARWVRKTSVEFMGSEMDLRPVSLEPTVNIRMNPAFYYDKVNGLVEDDRKELAELLGNSTLGEGAYTIQKVADAFEFVSSTLEYIPDPEGEKNEWLSPIACLERGGGDCEDYSVVLGAIITALGGTARVVITSEHAFCMIYVGGSDTLLSHLHDRYGAAIPFQIFEDDLGRWVLVEPQSATAFGWFPLNVLPSFTSVDRATLYGDPEMGWSFQNNDEVYVVDIYQE